MPELLAPADHLSPAQRAAEITQILARAILRQHADHTAKKEPVRLGLLPDQRVNVAPNPPERQS